MCDLGSKSLKTSLLSVFSDTFQMFLRDFSIVFMCDSIITIIIMTPQI